MVDIAFLDGDADQYVTHSLNCAYPDVSITFNIAGLPSALCVLGYANLDTNQVRIAKSATGAGTANTCRVIIQRPHSIVGQPVPTGI